MAADEREVTTELEEEGLEVPDERLLDVGLRVLVLETEELEDIGILDLVLGRHVVLGTCGRTLGEHLRLVAGESRPLVELRVDLSVELAERPATAKSFRFVEGARLGVPDPQQLHVV